MKGSVKMTAACENTAAALDSALLPVFGSPYMIALIESAAAGAVRAALEEGQNTVGTKFEIEHVAATPVGMCVWAEAELVQVDGKRLVFDVTAYDDGGLIGKGRHERFIVSGEKFVARANAKGRSGQTG